MSRHVAGLTWSAYLVRGTRFKFPYAHPGWFYKYPTRPISIPLCFKTQGKKKVAQLYSLLQVTLLFVSLQLHPSQKKKGHHSADLKYPLSPQKHSRNVPELEVSTVILVAFRDSGGGGGGRSETRPEMERNTPVRKPHTSTADLLTWSETPIADSASLTSSASRSASRPHQVSKFDFEIPCFGH